MRKLRHLILLLFFFISTSQLIKFIFILIVIVEHIARDNWIFGELHLSW